MNQLFAVKPDGRVARKLLQLAAVSNSTIDAKITALAQIGLINDQAFDSLPWSKITSANAVRHTIQKIVDNQYRCVLVSDKLETVRVAALAALYLGETKPLVICTHTPGEWNFLLRRFGMKASDQPDSQDQIILVDRKHLGDPGIIASRLQGRLIIEMSGEYDNRYDEHPNVSLERKFSGPAREFAETLVLCQINRHMALSNWGEQAQNHVLSGAKIIYPDGVDALLTEKVRGFNVSKQFDLLFMVGVISDLFGFDARDLIKESRETV